MSGMQILQQKTRNFRQILTGSSVAPTLKIQRCLPVGTSGEDCLNYGRQRFRTCALFHHNSRGARSGENWCATRFRNAPSKAVARFTLAPSEFFRDWIIVRASVGVAHIDLIELVSEYLLIMHLAVKTACEQAAHAKPAFETPCRSTLRTVERPRMRRDRN